MVDRELRCVSSCGGSGVKVGQYLKWICTEVGRELRWVSI